MTSYIFKPSRIKTKNGKPKRIESKIYRLCYRLDWMDKKQSVSLKTTDKQVAEKRAKEFMKELQQEHEGIIPDKATRLASSKSLLGHIEDYTTDLESCGSSPMHCYNVRKRLEKLCRECNWTLLRDVTPNSFQTWRNAQAKAAKTLKEYQDILNAFYNWMIRSKRCEENPLKGVSAVKTKGKEVRKRRALTFDEFRRFLDVAGPRRIGYLVAYFTGLRRGELRKLEWGDVHLEEHAEFFAVRANTTKNSKEAVMAIHQDLIKGLKELRPASFKSNDLVFTTKNIPYMDIMRKDLVAAGIPYKDEQGKQFDFHAIRHTANSHMAGIVDPQLRQKFMRHSDIRLTLNTYTDSRFVGTSHAVAALRSFEKDASMDAPSVDASGPELASSDKVEPDASSPEIPPNEILSPELAPDDDDWPDAGDGCLTRTRT